MKNFIWVCLSIITLSGCATEKILNVENATMDISPKELVKAGDVTTEKIVWGGVIVSSKNLKDYTQLEVLAYPLQRQLLPDLNKPPIGRFLMQHAGYLETEDFAPGRKLTAVGNVQQLSRHNIGEATVDVPMLQSEEVHLWPVQDEQSQSRFSFGLGISVGN